MSLSGTILKIVVSWILFSQSENYEQIINRISSVPKPSARIYLWEAAWLVTIIGDQPLTSWELAVSWNSSLSL